MPIKIKSCENSTGSIIFENSKINLDYLSLNSLSKPNLKTRSLYGGLNIINSDMKAKTIDVQDSKSEDAVNFINSDINIDKLELRNIQSDALDSDFSKLKISSLICYDIGNDCLDLSYSNGDISNIFAANIKDKVVSLGEKSNISILSVEAYDSEIGLVAKDQSILNINSCFTTK